MNFFRASTVTIFLLLNISEFSFSQSVDDEPFDLSTDKEIIIIGTGVAIGAAAIIINSNTSPLSSSEINSLNPQEVNAFDRIAIGPYESDVPGDILLYSSFVFPLSFLAYEKTRDDLGTISLMYGEALLINESINALVKVLTLRNRPFVFDKNSSTGSKLDVDAKYSFYSAHTSMTAVNTFYTAKVYSAYISNETTKTILWTVAALIPAITGFSRIETHNHFPTDVIVGYIVGAAIGYLIPEIHKTDNNNSNSNVTTSEEFVHRPIFGFQFSF